MAHKAGPEFFDHKRLWSERKDRILGSYLTAYLPKIAVTRQPVFIVDGFAGPGRFRDGSPGSPLVISEAIARARLSVPCRLLAIEAEPELCNMLRDNLAGYSFAEVAQGDFLEYLDRIEGIASKENVFLYLDPFAIKGIEWDPLDRVLQWVRRRSVELLMNFNGGAFVRTALAALGMAPAPESAEEPIVQGAHAQTLDRFLGTTDWRECINSSMPFEECVQRVTDLFCEQFRSRFQEVCTHFIYAEHTHSTPKYALLFGSRHPDAFVLMNDEMAKSTQTLAETALPADPVLFELRPTNLVPLATELEALVLQEAVAPMRRKDLIYRCMKQRFGVYRKAVIRGAIEALLKRGELLSATGKTRINDDVRVWRRTT